MWGTMCGCCSSSSGDTEHHSSVSLGNSEDDDNKEGEKWLEVIEMRRAASDDEDSAERDFELKRVSFMTMVWILVKKNFLLARRNKFGVFLKVCLPVLFIGVMGTLRLIPGTEKDKAAKFYQLPIDNQTINAWTIQGSNWIGPISCQPNIARADYRRDALYAGPGIVAFTPSPASSPVMQQLMDEMNASWGLPLNLSHVDNNWTNCDGIADYDECECFFVVASYTFDEIYEKVFRFFEDEDEALDYLDHKYYGYEGWGLTEDTQTGPKFRRPISTLLAFDFDDDNALKF